MKLKYTAVLCATVLVSSSAFGFVIARRFAKYVPAATGGIFIVDVAKSVGKETEGRTTLGQACLRFANLETLKELRESTKDVINLTNLTRAGYLTVSTFVNYWTKMSEIFSEQAQEAGPVLDGSHREPILKPNVQQPQPQTQNQNTPS